MHCSYQTQLELKKEIVVDLISRQLCHHENIVGLVKDPIASNNKFSYRQRIRLAVTKDKRFGFKKYQSHQIIPIQQCPIAHPEINQSLYIVNETAQFKSLLQKSFEFELQWNPDNSKISLIFFLNKRPRPSESSKARQLLQSHNTLETIIFKGNTFAPTTVTSENKNLSPHLGFTFSSTVENLPPIHFSWETGGFCQVNLEQNTVMLETVLNFLQVTKNDTVLDLFCGMGNFSIPLAFLAKSVYGVEGQRSSIRSAKKNATANGLTNTSFLQADIVAACKEFEKNNEVFDYVVLDPPRAGVPKLTRTISRLVKKKILYISCDPATLCRDLNGFLKENLTIKHIQPIDMFPQTHHIETLVLLEKN